MYDELRFIALFFEILHFCTEDGVQIVSLTTAFFFLLRGNLNVAIVFLGVVLY